MGAPPAGVPTMTLPPVAPVTRAVSGAAGIGRVWLIAAAAVTAVAVIGGGVAFARSRSDHGSNRTTAAADTRSGDRSSSGDSRGTGGSVGDDPTGTEPAGDDGSSGGSSGDRSPEAYCQVIETEMGKLESKYDAQTSALDSEDPGLEDILGAFTMVAALPSDLARVFAKAEQVAPPEIEVETREIKENFQKQADQLSDLAGDAASDPLAALFSSLASALVDGSQMQEPLDRFDAYTRQHCDLG